MLFRRRQEADPALAGGPGRAEANGHGGGTVVGARTCVRGLIRGIGPVLVRGAVQGEIAIRSGLTVSPTGRLEAEVEARSLDLSGEARGAVRAISRVVMAPTGVFEGDLATPVLEVQPGSVLRGRARVAGHPASGSDRTSL